MSRNLLSIFSRTESKRNELKKQSKSCLSAQFLGKTAREVGFIKRQFSLKIVKFFESLLCSIGTGGNTKITVQKLFSDYNQRVKKSERLQYKPFHNRMRQNELVALLVSTYKHLQSKVLRLVLKRDFVELLDSLNQNGLEIDDIYLHDGSYWKIKDCFYELFKGTRNALKPTPVEGTIDENGEPAEDEPKYAEVGIQSTYSCKHGAICECNVSAGVDDERNYVYKTVSDNVLHILDAGYVSFDLFGEIDSKCGYFICKLRGNSAGCIKSCKLGNEDLTADFASKKLSHKMVRDFKRAELLDMTVEFNGKEYRVIRIYSKKHQKSQFLITNIRNSRITAKAIKMLYKIRWQIELEFKNLKSCDKLRGATTGVLNIMLSMLLLSLIVNLIQVLYTFVLQIKSKAKLSLYRISYYAGESFKKFVKALIYCSFKKFEVSLKNILEFTKPYERVKQSVQKELEFKTLESTISAIKIELDKSRVESIDFGF